MAEKSKSPEPLESENMARFKRTLTALVAVPKDEAFAAYLKKNFSAPKRLMAGGKIGEVETPKGHKREREEGRPDSGG